MKTVNLLRELELVDEYWSPRVVGEVNDQYIKVAKLKGTLAWHKHDDEDDFHVVPKGTMHNNSAKASPPELP